MNRTRLIVIAGVSLLLSIGVTMVAYYFLQARLAPPESTIPVVVAAQDLPLGKMITAEDVKVVPWHKSFPLEGAFHDVELPVGRGVVIPMQINEPLLELKLAPSEAGAGITPAIPDGMRAMSIQVNDVIGVAGFVLPGTRVDLILTGSPQMDGKLSSKVILENLQVIAAGQNVQRDANGKPETVQVVTVLVTPEQAQKIALATTDGPIRLALRNPLDMKNVEPAAIDRASLYLGQVVLPKPVRKRQVSRAPYVRKTEPETEPVPASRLIVVELIQGSMRETETFEEQRTAKGPSM